MIATAELEKSPAVRSLSGTASAHLDLARGLAAAAVAFQHVRFLLLLDWPQVEQRSPLIAGMYLLAKFAHPAVIVFFVLSGYLVGSSGVRAVEQRRWSFPRYMLHRFLRLEIVLLPALLLTLLWDSAGIHLLHASPLYEGKWHLLMRSQPIHLDWRTLLGNAFFLQDILVPTFGTNSALWSLSYEFWYYVLFGLIVTALLRTTRLWLRLLTSALILVVAWFTGPGIMSLAPVWFLGLGVHYLPRIDLSAGQRRAMLAGSVVIFLTFLEFTFGRALWLWGFLHSVTIDIITATLFALVLYASLHANPASARYQRAAHLIAAPTYSLYANHLPAVIFLLACLGMRRAPTLLRCIEVAGWFVVCWFYGYLLYRLFEARTAAVRSWIEDKLFS